MYNISGNKVGSSSNLVKKKTLRARERRENQGWGSRKLERLMGGDSRGSVVSTIKYG